MMASWKTITRQVAFSAPPYLNIVKEAVEVAPGLRIDDFWQVELRSFAVIVPVLDDGRVAVLSGYRHGPRADCLSLPGGYIEARETAEQAVERELLEETGLVADRVISLGDFVDNGNQRGAHGHYFLGLGAKLRGEVRADPTEIAELHFMDVLDLDRAVDSGRFKVIHHLAGWCLARRHLEFP